MSVAVWAISGVWWLVSSVPLFSMKLSRCGICSRSDGTFGLSRKKCTLSNVICTTCCTPLPSEQAGDAAVVAADTAFAGGKPTAVAKVAAARTALILRAPDRNEHLLMRPLLVGWVGSVRVCRTGP